MALFIKLLLGKVKGFVCCNEGRFYFFSTLLKGRVLY